MNRPWTVSGSLLAGVAAAIGASACCAGPLLLVLLGVGGAWGSRLVALEPLQPVFIAAAVVFFGLAFRRLYRPQQDCQAADGSCSVPAVRRRQRVAFWVLGTAAIALMSFPLYASWFN